MTLESLIRRLEEIARANDDEFRYGLLIKPLSAGRFRYDFTAEETADQHVFVGGSGHTEQAAVDDAAGSILDACEQWGYVDPTNKNEH